VGQPIVIQEICILICVNRCIIRRDLNVTVGSVSIYIKFSYKVLRDLRFQLPFEKYVKNIRKLDVRIQEVSLL